MRVLVAGVGRVHCILAVPEQGLEARIFHIHVELVLGLLRRSGGGINQSFVKSGDNMQDTKWDLGRNENRAANDISP